MDALEPRILLDKVLNLALSNVRVTHALCDLIECPSFQLLARYAAVATNINLGPDFVYVLLFNRTINQRVRILEVAVQVLGELLLVQ